MKRTRPNKDSEQKSITRSGSIHIGGNVSKSIVFTRYTNLPKSILVVLSLVLIISIPVFVVTLSQTDVGKRVAGLIGIGNCFVFDPETETPNEDRVRDCRPGYLTYIKWHDPHDYVNDRASIDTNDTINWPYDRANRTVQLVRKISGDNDRWNEQNLTKIVAGEPFWPAANHQYVSITYDHSGVDQTAPNTVGIILRRMDKTVPTGSDGNTECDRTGGFRSLLELFIPNDAPERIAEGKEVRVWLRRVSIPCGIPIPPTVIDGPPFKPWNRIVSAKRD